MKTLRLILGDQLSRAVSALRGIDRANDVVLLAEVRDEATYVRKHRQKITLVLAAMRHFAQALRAEGLRVDYVSLDDENNTGRLKGEVGRALARHHSDRVVVTEPGEWRLWESMRTWADDFGVPVESREDDRFLCSRADFARWTDGRKSLRMEYFYRHMRLQTGWLMNGDKPMGGRWNFDAENRKALPRNLRLPSRRRFESDPITQTVIDLVERSFADHFGDMQSFGWAVTREDALAALQYFIADCLPQFGDYQDAMKSGED